MRYILFITALLFTLNASAQSGRDAPVLHAKDTSGTTSKDSTVFGEKPYPDYDLANYLGEHLHYPEKARRWNNQGRVLVKFVVNEDGSVSDVSVIKGIKGGCNKEAMRVVSNMPPWNPGKLNGKPVKVYFTLPIVFKLED